MSAPCPKCAELAAALDRYGTHLSYCVCRQFGIDGYGCDCGYCADREQEWKPVLAAHDAAKDAEIQRLRGALETIDALVSSDPDMSGNPRWHFRSARGQQVADAIAKLKAALEVQP